MTPSEIAETLINGNISDARDAILTYGDGSPHAGTEADIAVRTLDVLMELLPPGREDFDDWRSAHARLRRCLTGGT
jgi:hypothetical protein